MLLKILHKLFTPQIPDAIKILPAETYRKELRKKHPLLIDVRTAREFQQGHIEGAKNLDIFHRQDFISAMESLSREKPVFLYCRSGQRSQRAARVLVRMGFREVVDLRGGFLKWN